MNFVVISKDESYLNEIKNKINENIHYYFISTYSSFKEYKKKKKVFEINCFIIDMDLDDWFENTKTIYKENAHYIFIGSNLKESYKVYSFEKVIYVYKNEFSYFENLNDMCLALKEHLSRFFYIQKSKISNNNSEKLKSQFMEE